MKAGRRSGRWIMLLLFGALVAVPTTAIGAETEVTIKLARFNPPNITIAPGDTVVWKDEEGGHSVTFDDGFDQPQGCLPVGGPTCSEKGETFKRSFSEQGDFPYYCKVHRSTMTGVVSVKAPGPSVTSTTVPATATTQPPTTASTASTTTTTRKLATSSTLAPTTTSTAPAESTTTFPPNEAPAFDPEDGGGDGGSDEASPAGSGGGGGDSGPGTVALIVAALLAVAGGGSVLLWRLRPRSAQP